ncbi:MAG: hypothetical protein ACP5D2_01295 [Candidatus Nanoarchaeia archaeon]
MTYEEMSIEEIKAEAVRRNKAFLASRDCKVKGSDPHINTSRLGGYVPRRVIKGPRRSRGRGDTEH